MTSEALNKLRAGILGANDGIISVATTLIAILGVFGNKEIAVIAGAVLIAGAISMAAGEYVSVSAHVNHEEESEHALSDWAAVHAAVASFFAFLAGGLIPALAAIVFHSVLAVVIISFVLLGITGYISSGKGGHIRSVTKLTLVGILAFGVSYGINLFLQTLGI